MNVTEINYNDIPLLSNNEKMPLLETVFQSKKFAKKNN